MFGIKPLLGLEPMAPIRPQLLVSHANHSATKTSLTVCDVCIYVCMYAYLCVCVCVCVYIYIYIYIVEEGLDGHGLLLLRVSRVMRSSDCVSDDRITRETLSNNNPCPSSPSSTILRSAYMALNTLQQDWLL